jgi:hypothetical protein
MLAEDTHNVIDTVNKLLINWRLSILRLLPPAFGDYLRWLIA